jgi:murein DD-endopeptidase MepM/ murein hydrolase activator NlpD
VDIFRTIEIKWPTEAQWPIIRDVGDMGGHWSTFHKGIDIGCPTGTSLFHHEGGEVQIAGLDPEELLGNRVWILFHHMDYGQVRVGYCHLDSIASGYLEVGTKITEGVSIGKSGHSGNVASEHGGDGSHLHLQAETWPAREILKPILV